MAQPTKEIREANNALSWGMVTTGFELILLAIMFGGSAFFLQWGVWFIVVGYAVYSVIQKGVDAVDWVSGKLPWSK